MTNKPEDPNDYWMRYDYKTQSLIKTFKSKRTASHAIKQAIELLEETDKTMKLYDRTRIATALEILKYIEGIKP